MLLNNKTGFIDNKKKFLLENAIKTMGKRSEQPLTAKQKMFCKEYIIDLNASQACLRAGYKTKKPHIMGAQNLSKPIIKNEIQRLMKGRVEKLDLTADMVLKELMKLGFGNTQNLYDENGRLLLIHELPRDVAATITEVTADPINGRKYKVASKLESLKLLGQYFKLFADRPAIDENSVNSLSLEQIQAIGTMFANSVEAKVINKNYE